MKLFEQSAPQDTLPLVGNSFTVDSSISELTLLVFRAADAKATEITTPDGERYSQKSQVEGLRWKHDSGYDLISVSPPKPGEWKINADEDPDNRAMIVTDLKLKSGPLQNNVLNGEEVLWRLWLEEEGEIINNAEFLQLLTVSVNKLENGKELQSWVVSTESADGQFEHYLGPKWDLGEHEYLIKVDGGTFVREKRLTIQAFSMPVEFHAESLSEDLIKTLFSVEGDSSSQAWKFEITALAELIDFASSNIEIEVRSQSDQLTKLNPEKNEMGWSLNFLATEIGQHRVSLTFKGKSLSGREIVAFLEPLPIGEYVTIPEPEIEVTVEIEEDVESNVITDNDTKEQNPPSLKEIIIPVVIGNLFFALLFMGWVLLKRMRKAKVLQPEEVL